MKTDRRGFLKMFAGALLVARTNAVGAGPSFVRVYSADKHGYIETPVVARSDVEWRKLLTEQQFQILRRQGTEPAFTGKYWNNHERGIYACAGCGNDLFDSATKFESGTGWPSFWQPIAKENIATSNDHSLLMDRTEVHCARCGGHQGHVFDDGPKPTGLRYCINSASLQLKRR